MHDVNAPVRGSIPGLARHKVDTICIEPPQARGGVTLPCWEHCQVMLPIYLGAPYWVPNNQKVSLMPKLFSAIAGIRTADPLVIGYKPNASIFVCRAAPAKLVLFNTVNRHHSLSLALLSATLQFLNKNKSPSFCCGTKQKKCTMLDTVLLLLVWDQQGGCFFLK